MSDDYKILEDSGQVLKKEVVGDHVIWEHYSMIYKVDLTADRQEILADGQDKATITARIKTWDGNDVTYNGDIHFEINGEKIITKQFDNGVALFEFCAETSGFYDIVAFVNDFDNKIDGGYIVIKAKEQDYDMGSAE